MRTQVQMKKARFLGKIAEAIIESDAGVESIDYITRPERWPHERIEIAFTGSHAKRVVINTTGNSNGLNLAILYSAIWGAGATGEFEPAKEMVEDPEEERSSFTARKEVE